MRLIRKVLKNNPTSNHATLTCGESIVRINNSVDSDEVRVTYSAGHILRSQAGRPQISFSSGTKQLGNPRQTYLWYNRPMSSIPPLFPYDRQMLPISSLTCDLSTPPPATLGPSGIRSARHMGYCPILGELKRSPT